MSAKILGPIKPPTSQTIEAYRAAVLAYRTSYRPSTRGGVQDNPLIPKAAAAAAVRKLRPDLTDSEAEVLAHDAVTWAEQLHNECFWDL
ncbi:MAG: hypothetical protein WBX25_12055 [Rhodomicrobium sp.]